MKKAQITKIISKEYTIKTAENEYLIANLAGKLRKGDYPVVGDYVDFETFDNHHIIKKIYERKNYLIRPNLANIDQVIIVMSTHDPEFSFELCNRLIILVEYNHIKPILCISKNDLSDEISLKEIKKYYSNMNYEIHDTGLFDSAEFIKNILKNKLTVLCGQSGVGKSTLLNKIDKSLNLKTQEISKALNRGKHTTRHVELFECFGGYLADTPGFSSIDLTDVDKYELSRRISAFEPFINDCRFLDCVHISEPDCAIKQAVIDNLIPQSFYDTYLNIFNFIINDNMNANAHRTLK